MSMRARFDPIELEAVKERTPLSQVFARLGVKTRGGAVSWCLCPLHGEKTPSCKIDDRRGSWKCFGCGQSGDHFDILMHLRGLTFVEAVQELGGVRKVSDAERAEIKRKQEVLEKEEAEERRKKRLTVQEWWDRLKPIVGTKAASYLQARGLPVNESWTFDLRYAAEAKYQGFPDEKARESKDLGRFPAMIAAIRNHAGEIIGLHRTYLDPSVPKKLSPPGDRSRNGAKKVFGEQRGGLIWLSKPAARMAIGEGIETTRSWYLLGGGGGDEIALAAAVSLGNLAGRSTGSVTHPFNPQKKIPNGEPDLDEAAIVLPETVREVTLIGDGDSDPAMTRARLLCASKRFVHQGKEVFVSMAPDGVDFNDVLLSELERDAA